MVYPYDTAMYPMEALAEWDYIKDLVNWPV
jgi:hypothetical protein